jgi:hypothetical protein
MANFVPTLRLLQRGFVNFGASGTTQQLLITNLNPAKTYDLYIASAILITTNQCSRGEWFTTNTTSTVGNQAVDNRENENGSTWVRGNNYVLFEDVVPNGSGNITVNGFAITEQPTYDIRLPLNGFQLVESAPGYASWAAVHAGGQAADQDWNGDGVQNGIAYFMGETGMTTNPGIVDGKVRWKKAVTDAYAVKVSTELQSWGDAPGGTVTEEVIGSDTYVVFTLPTGGPILFGRLEVTIP